MKHDKGKPLPVVYEHILKCEWTRTFPFWQRIGILFGSSLVVQIGIVTRHDPGPWQPLILGNLSTATDAEARHREIIENMLAAKKESLVQTEPKPNEPSIQN